MEPIRIINMFESFIKGLKSDENTVKNPATDFIRKRKIGFEKTLKAIISMGPQNLENNLADFFGYNKANLPNKSAFVQAREKLSDRCFPFIFSEFNKLFPFTKKYKGYRLIACDGSDVNIPPNNKDTSTMLFNKSITYYQVHLNTLYDICEERICSVNIQTASEKHENAAMIEMMSSLNTDSPQNTILIADRWYSTIDNFAFLLENGYKFLIRAKSPASANSLFMNLAPKGIEFDNDISFFITRSRKKMREHPYVYKNYRPGGIYNYMKYNVEYPISLRFVCVTLDNGELEYLATNLSREEFSPLELKKLYWQRWKTEQSYLHLKYHIDMLHFHSKRRDFIYQEIYASIIMYNLSSLVASNTPSKKSTKKPKKWKYKQSYAAVANVVRKYIIKPIAADDLLYFLQRNLSPIRPGREYIRKVRACRAIPLNLRP